MMTGVSMDSQATKAEAPPRPAGFVSPKTVALYAVLTALTTAASGQKHRGDKKEYPDSGHFRLHDYFTRPAPVVSPLRGCGGSAGPPRR